MFIHVHLESAIPGNKLATIACLSPFVGSTTTAGAIGSNISVNEQFTGFDTLNCYLAILVL